jgi:hypothetical protein
LGLGEQTWWGIHSMTDSWMKLARAISKSQKLRQDKWIYVFKTFSWHETSKAQITHFSMQHMLLHRKSPLSNVRLHRNHICEK